MRVIEIKIVVRGFGGGWLGMNIATRLVAIKYSLHVERRKSSSPPPLPVWGGGGHIAGQLLYCIVLLRFCWDLAALENFVNVILICVEFGMASVFIFVDVQ